MFLMAESLGLKDHRVLVLEAILNSSKISVWKSALNMNFNLKLTKLFFKLCKFNFLKYLKDYNRWASDGTFFMAAKYFEQI